MGESNYNTLDLNVSLIIDNRIAKLAYSLLEIYSILIIIILIILFIERHIQQAVRGAFYVITSIWLLSH